MCQPRILSLKKRSREGSLPWLRDEAIIHSQQPKEYNLHVKGKNTKLISLFNSVTYTCSMVVAGSYCDKWSKRKVRDSSLSFITIIDFLCSGAWEANKQIT